MSADQAQSDQQMVASAILSETAQPGSISMEGEFAGFARSETASSAPTVLNVTLAGVILATWRKEMVLEK